MLGARQYVPRLRGLKPPGGVRIHIAGIDLIRSPDGVLRVLEDNLRTPSGVSYVIENRLVTKRMFPTRARAPAASAASIDYPIQLADTLRSVSPVDPDEVDASVVLTPGPYNSAYFEHSFLARTMGIELVAGVGPVRRRRRGLRADDARAAPGRTSSTAASTTPSSIPEFFRPDSLLGVPGLMRA